MDSYSKRIKILEKRGEKLQRQIDRIQLECEITGLEKQVEFLQGKKRAIEDSIESYENKIAILTRQIKDSENHLELDDIEETAAFIFNSISIMASKYRFEIYAPEKDSKTGRTAYSRISQHASYDALNIALETKRKRKKDAFGVVIPKKLSVGDSVFHEDGYIYATITEYGKGSLLTVEKFDGKTAYFSKEIMDELYVKGYSKKEKGFIVPKEKMEV